MFYLWCTLVFANFIGFYTAVTETKQRMHNVFPATDCLWLVKPLGLYLCRIIALLDWGGNVHPTTFSRVLTQIWWVFFRGDRKSVTFGALPRQFAKHGKWGEFAAWVTHPRAARSSASGGFAPKSTPLGAPPQTPVIYARSPRSPCVSTPRFWPGDPPVKSRPNLADVPNDLFHLLVHA